MSSISFSTSLPSSITSGPPISIQELKIRLRKWCDLAKYSTEYSSRINAAQQIENCYAIGAKSLDLSNNQLTDLPAEIGLLTNLARLDLSNNQLTNLPTEIGLLTELIFLNLSNNQLTDLPATIWKLPKLICLALDNNQLTDLDAEIGKLTELKFLFLSNNQLTALPTEIGKLTELEFLFLSNNQLTDLPAEIWKLAKLKTLELCKNRIPNLDAEFTKFGMNRDQMHSPRCINVNKMVEKLTQPVQKKNETNSTPFLMLPLPLVGGHVQLWELIAEYATRD